MIFTNGLTIVINGLEKQEILTLIHFSFRVFNSYFLLYIIYGMLLNYLIIKSLQKKIVKSFKIKISRY